MKDRVGWLFQFYRLISMEVGNVGRILESASTTHPLEEVDGIRTSMEMGSYHEKAERKMPGLACC